MTTITYCPELAVFRIFNGVKEIVVTPVETAVGGRWHKCKSLFDAKKAVEEGRAIAGIWVDA